jgi:predicted Rossmann-fold nucleotide-binding protein
MKPIPVLLFGKEFWTRVIDFGALAREGVISVEDLELITWCETAEDAWGHIAEFYNIDPHPRRVV